MVWRPCGLVCSFVPTPSAPPPLPSDAAAAAAGAAAGSQLDPEASVSKFARSAATTFAPRASGATGKNPAYKGSTLYTVFEVQAALAVVVGGLLAFNVIWPSDQPNVARLLG